MLVLPKLISVLMAKTSWLGCGWLITSLFYTLASTIHNYHTYEGTELMFSNFPQGITLEVSVLKFFYTEVKNKPEGNTHWTWLTGVSVHTLFWRVSWLQFFLQSNFLLALSNLFQGGFSFTKFFIHVTFCPSVSGFHIILFSARSPISMGEFDSNFQRNYWNALFHSQSTKSSYFMWS